MNIDLSNTRQAEEWSAGLRPGAKRWHSETRWVGDRRSGFSKVSKGNTHGR